MLQMQQARPYGAGLSISEAERCCAQVNKLSEACSRVGRTVRLKPAKPQAPGKDSRQVESLQTCKLGTPAAVPGKKGSRRIRWRDHACWKFKRLEFDKFVAPYGTFTVDACATPETAQAEKFYSSQKSFLKADVRG